MAKCEFNGPVGQVITTDNIGRIDTTITMGPNGEMTVESTITDTDK